MLSDLEGGPGRRLAWRWRRAARRGGDGTAVWGGWRKMVLAGVAGGVGWVGERSIFFRTHNLWIRTDTKWPYVREEGGLANRNLESPLRIDIFIQLFVSRGKETQ
jgi:hypothetical protein